MYGLLQNIGKARAGHLCLLYSEDMSVYVYVTNLFM